MIDAKAMRDISDKEHQKLVNEEAITLTQFIESEISKAAQDGCYYVNVNIDDYYEEAVCNVKEKLTSFCYDVIIDSGLGRQKTMNISW